MDCSVIVTTTGGEWLSEQSTALTAQDAPPAAARTLGGRVGHLEGSLRHRLLFL